MQELLDAPESVAAHGQAAEQQLLGEAGLGKLMVCCTSLHCAPDPPRTYANCEATGNIQLRLNFSFPVHC